MKANLVLYPVCFLVLNFHHFQSTYTQSNHSENKAFPEERKGNGQQGKRHMYYRGEYTK